MNKNKEIKTNKWDNPNESFFEKFNTHFFFFLFFSFFSSAAPAVSMANHASRAHAPKRAECAMDMEHVMVMVSEQARESATAMSTIRVK